MPDIGSEVARHYDIAGLEARILTALAGTGADVAHLRPEDLEPIDEFHIGGVPALEALLSQLPLVPGEEVLDIGSGIGGPARFIARRTGARVTGIDLTPSYVTLAARLSQATGLGGETDFVAGDATAMPFEAGRFGAAIMLHVGMNIADKPALLGEVARVLRPGGSFALFDVMRFDDRPLAFPLPWAGTAETSFVTTPEAYRSAARAAGFEVLAERSRGPFAIEFFAAMRARAAAAVAAGRPPPPGIGLVMGSDAPIKLANLTAALESGTLAPVEMILRLAVKGTS